VESQEHGDANAPEGKARGARTRRRTTAKAPTDNGKRSLNLRIDEDSYRRLSVHALMRNATISELVMEFARDHLREFSIHRNAARSEQGE
jgi:hypothetical protein